LHLQALAEKFEVSLQNVSEKTALIAVQGPKTVGLFSKLLPEVCQLKYYHFMKASNGWLVARTGYTGEDGYEITLPAEHAAELWKALAAAGVRPCGQCGNVRTHEKL
jgi:aminomethyltransferase